VVILSTVRGPRRKARRRRHHHGRQGRRLWARSSRPAERGRSVGERWHLDLLLSAGSRGGVMVRHGPTSFSAQLPEPFCRWLS
jgi:hypothetical protein